MQKLVIPLTKAGRRLLQSAHGKLRATMQDATTVGVYTQKNTLAIKVKVAARSKHKHHTQRRH